MYLSDKISQAMERILGFGRFDEIRSAKIRIRRSEDLGGEVCHHVLVSINEQRIEGQIFADSDGELECWQLYDAEGRCLSEKYGHDEIDKLIKKKLNKIKK